MHMMKISVIVFGLFLACFVQGSASESDWVAIAAQDTDFIYNVLKENHPGYYDVENPGWKNLLDSSYRLIKQKSLSITNKEHYKRLLADFIQVFNDKHLYIESKDKEQLPQNRYTHLRLAQIKKVANGIQIILPTFAPSNPLELTALQQVINTIHNYRTSSYIIFDVRSNTGGNSDFAEQLLKNLFTQEYFDYCIDQVLKKYNTYIEWRASSGNSAHLEYLLQPNTIKEMGLDEIVPWLTTVVEGMKNAAATGKKYFTETIALKNINKVNNPISMRIGLITDSRCASACLDFIDMLMALNPVEHFGQPTSSDTNYMDVRTVTVPSTMASVTFPIKVYRNRPRKSGEKYTPEHLCDTKDTKAIINHVSNYFENNVYRCCD